MLIHTWGIRRVISKNFESYITILGVFPKEHLIHSTGETKMAFEKRNPKSAAQQDTTTGSAADPIFAQPRDPGQEQTWTGAHPPASAS